MTTLFPSVDRFLAWWGGELAGLLGGGMRDTASRPRGRWLMLTVNRDGLGMVEVNGTREIQLIAAGATAENGTAIGERLAALTSAGARQRVGIQVAADLCFARTIELPIAARDDAARILALDLERSTPFRAADVLVGHTIEQRQSSAGKVVVRHLIAKTSHIEAASKVLAQHGLAPQRIECRGSDGRATIVLREAAADERMSGVRKSGLGGWLKGALALASVLAVAVAGLEVQKQETALATVKAMTAAARAAADKQRVEEQRATAALASFEALQELRLSTLSRVMVLEELTRLLPDTAYLTALSIDGSVITLSGLSGSASALVPLIERSARFVDARLTAPVTFDVQLGKERFSLSARIRPLANGTGLAGGAQAPGKQP